MFNNLYKPYIENEERVTRKFLRPLEIYRISTYKYTDGGVESLAGPKSALVFCIGVVESKERLHCIKLSKIRPDYFFRFLKKIKNKSLTESKIDESEHLYDMMLEYGSDKTGRVLYDRTISKLVEYKSLKRIADPYRTYDINGIRYIRRVNFKKDILKQILL